MKILVAVDGSDISLRAVDFAIRLSGMLADPPQLTLLAVDIAMFPGVEKRIGAEAVARMHADTHERLLKPSRDALTAAGLSFEVHTGVGDIAQTILDVADKGDIDLIIMGSHGRGAVKGVLLGSVSSKVIAQASIPVTVVR